MQNMQIYDILRYVDNNEKILDRIQNFIDHYIEYN